jgi:hypothetical protein
LAETCNDYGLTRTKEAKEMFKLALQYTRYALAALATVAFRLTSN